MKTKLLLMLLAIGLVAGTAQANMLLNPGFEEGAFGGNNHTPEYWEHFYTSSPPVHTWVGSATGAHSGSKFMKMYNWTSGPYSAFLGQEVLGVKEDGDYTFSVWAKTTAVDLTKTASIYVDWYNTSSALTSSAVGWIDYEIVSVPVTGDTWTEVDFGDLTAPEGAIAAVFWLTASTENGADAICYDDASMLGPDPNVHAGPDMISWDGETVSLTGSTFLPGYSTIAWTAEPADGISIADGDTLEPDVTITLSSPDLTTYKLTLDIDDGKYDIMEIDVYSTCCEATIAADKNNLTDIDANCFTNLGDFAELAETWLNNTKLTEPVAKP